MKYFIDTEFLEGTQTKKVLGFNVGQTKPTIDLISIGIVAEDGREYYAISKEFNLKEAWNREQKELSTGSKNPLTGKSKISKCFWLRENVLKPIYKELYDKECLYARQALYRASVYIKEPKYKFTYRNLKKLIKKYGKTNAQIAEEVKVFCSKHLLSSDPVQIEADATAKEFYGYYADYDWVVFCWLFGTMMNLPKGFPMYCNDLKQTLDEKNIQYCLNTEYKLRIEKGVQYINQRYSIKNHPDYPKQTNEHNALADARWNKKLYEFLKSL